MTTEITNWQESLARHAISLAFEGNGIEIYTDDGVDCSFDPYSWTVETFDAGDGEATIHATQEGYVPEKISHGSRMHPPEYKNHDVELHMVVEFFPEDNGGLGHAKATIEQEGGLPGPDYEYDPMEDR